MNTGRRIRERREAVGISAEKLADKLGIAKTTIYRYEKGIIEKISADILNRMAFHLQTTPDYLLGKTDDPEIENEQYLKHGYSPYTFHDNIEYDKTVDKTAEILKAIQRNPRLLVLFDKSKKLKSWQLNAVLGLVDAIAKEKDEL